MVDITLTRQALERGVASFAVLLPFPHRRKVDLALGATIGRSYQAVDVVFLVLCDVVDDSL